MRTALLTGILMLASGRSEAQSGWSLTLLASASRYSVAFHDTSSPQVVGKPWYPRSYGFRIARDGRRLGFGATVSATDAEEGAQIEEFKYLPGLKLIAMTLAPEMRWRALQSGQDATLIVHAGPTIDVWKPDGADHRARWGAAGGATLSLPLTENWRVEVRGEGGISGSYVNEDETSDEVKRTSSMRRATLGLGITKRW